MTQRMNRPIARTWRVLMVFMLVLTPMPFPFVGAFALEAAEHVDPAPDTPEIKGTHIVNLKVEYRTSPISIDTTPRFNWNMISDIRGQKQTAYQLLVASSPEKLTTEETDGWNSGIVNSGSSVAIEYAGPKHKPTTRYYWTVKVWDRDGFELPMPEAQWFETGVMSTDGVAGLDGAKLQSGTYHFVSNLEESSSNDAN